MTTEQVFQRVSTVDYDEYEDKAEGAFNENRLEEYDTEVYEYYVDCSMPLMPDIEEHEYKTRNTESQSQPFHSLISSVMSCVNGIAMHVMAIGFDLANAILPSSSGHKWKFSPLLKISTYTLFQLPFYFVE